MTCASCQALRERVRVLERELGVRRRTGEIGAVMSAFGLTATQARLLLRLYAAGGRAVAFDVLIREVSTTGRDSLKTFIHQMRLVVGADAICSFRDIGYGLSIPMVSRVLAALQPLELQDVRGLTEEPAGAEE